MPKKSFTEGNWRSDPWFKSLCRAILACRNEKQLAEFLRDVGTLAELQAWSERWEVAKRVAQGQTYRGITKQTGASTTTVTRVARFLQDGQGYKRVMKKSPAHHHASSSHAGRGRH